MPGPTAINGGNLAYLLTANYATGAVGTTPVFIFTNKINTEYSATQVSTEQTDVDVFDTIYTYGNPTASPDTAVFKYENGVSSTSSSGNDLVLVSKAFIKEDATEYGVFAACVAINNESGAFTTVADDYAKPTFILDLNPALTPTTIDASVIAALTGTSQALVIPTGYTRKVFMVTAA